MTQLLGETNARLDETNARPDETNASLQGFRHEVTGKLDGISNFLIASEDARQKLGGRVTRLGNKGPAA
jgi:hypothetical protein